LPCQSRERQLFMGRRAPLPEIAGVKLPEGTRCYLP
jgi:hypothetical protein